MNTNAECKKFESELIDLVLTPGAKPSVAAVAHMKACPPCAEEFTGFQTTFSALDSWHAPAPTPYFDQKLAVRIREEQAAPAMGWFESLATRLRFNTGRSFRPAVVGALSFALLVGAGSGIGFSGILRPATPVQASAAVTDLQILNRNETAFQQMDELQQDEDSAKQPIDDSSQVAPPIS